MLNARKIGSFLFLTLMAVACLDQPDCYNLTNNYINISYRRIHDGSIDTVLMTGVTIAGLDSVFTSGRSSVKIPIDFTANGISVMLDGVESDRLLDISYKVQHQFVSEECGPRFVLSDLKVSSPSGDSVKLLASVPSTLTSTTPHIAVYRCPRNNMVRLAFRQTIDNKIVRDTLSIVRVTANYSARYYYAVTGNLSFVNLPLNLNSVSTQFNLQLANPDRTVAVTFTYDLVTKTVYEFCGPQTFITNVQMTSAALEGELVETTRYVADSIYDPPKINFAVFQ